MSAAYDAAVVEVARELYEAQRTLEHPHRAAWADAGNVVQSVYVAIVEHLLHEGVIDLGTRTKVRAATAAVERTPLEQRLGQVARET